jgi:hypothetical protein
MPDDLDCDGTSDITGPASLSVLSSTLRLIRDRAVLSDRVLIQFSGHGTLDRRSVFSPPEAGVIGYGDDSPVLSQSEVQNALDLLGPHLRTAILTTTCYGGNFQELARANRCVLTSSPRDQEAHSFVNEYAALPEGIATGLLGQTLGGFQSLNALDLNEDGILSLTELFRNVHEDIPSNHPMISSSEIRSRDATESESGRRMIEGLYRRIQNRPSRISTPDPVGSEDRRRRGFLEGALATQLQLYQEGCDGFYF